MRIGKAPKRDRLKTANPFRRPEGGTQALGAARSGALVSVYLALSYLVQLASLNSNGIDTYGNTGPWILISHIADVILAAFLTWLILARQPLWAAIVAAAWYAVELVLKIEMVLSGERQASAGLILIFVVIAAAAIIGIQGSLKLRQLRRSAGIAEQFD